MDFEPDYQAPPPAYSEEQEFDQKVSIATERSVHEPVLDADGWEVYDPYAFEHIEANIHDCQSKRNKSSDFLGINKNTYELASDFKANPQNHRGHFMNPLASSSQWHETNSLPILVKPDCQKMDGSSSFNGPYHQHKGHYSSDGECHSGTHSGPVSAQVWQSERHQTPIQYSYNSYDVRSSPSLHDNGMSHRPSYRSMLNDTLPQYGKPSTKLRSLPPTPGPPRQQIAHHSVKPPASNFDTSLAYSSSIPSISGGHHQLTAHMSSFDGDVQYNTYSLYNAAVSAQLNTLKNHQHQSTSFGYGQQQSQMATRSSTFLSPNRGSHLVGPNSAYVLPEIPDNSMFDNHNNNNRPPWQ